MALKQSPRSPEAFALLILLVVFVLRFAWARISTGSWYVYALDDPYITFAVARNIGTEGALFLPTGESSAPVSSLLWTLLLVPVAMLDSLLLLVGFVFLLMALAFGSIIRGAGNWFAKDGIEGTPRAAWLLLYLFLFGAIPLESTGLEHALHVAVSLAVFQFACDPAPWTGKRRILVLALTFALPGLRYESAFLLTGIGAALLWEGKSRRVLQLAAASILGALFFALVMKLLSGHWLSTSVLAKVNTFDGVAQPSLLPSLARLAALEHFPFNYLLLAANGLLLLLLQRDDSERAARWRFAAITFCVGMVLHASLGRFRWLERYEAYLLAIGLLPILSAAHHHLWRPRSAMTPTARRRTLLLALPLLFVVANTAMVKTQASRLAFTMPAIIHRYHGLLAELFSIMPPVGDLPVAISDIGTVSWQTPKMQYLDLAGLASPSLMAAQREGDPAAALSQWLRERRPWALIAPPSVVPELVRRDYILVAEWGTLDQWGNFIPYVCFFAAEREHEPYLRQSVRQLEPRLPEEAVYREFPPPG